MGSLVVSVDSVVEGVHVDLSLCTPADVGWKALMGAVSDLAAMGASPIGALIALCVPGGSGNGEVALGVMGGVAEASAAALCPVVGGDVSSAEPGGRGGDRARVRGAGRDRGDPGGSGGGGRHPGHRALWRIGGGAAPVARRRRRRRRGGAYRRPVARLREGDTARRSGATAMIDVSDGLALDLHRLADASGVGFELGDVPVADGATLEEALGGGEDYELLLTVAAGVTRRRSQPASRPRGCARRCGSGWSVADATERTLQGEPLARLGWQHTLG